MVFICVLAGIIVLLSVVLILRGRHRARAYGAESAESLAGKADLATRKAEAAAIMTHNVGQ